MLSVCVIAFRTSPEGKEQIIHRLGPRELFADVSLFPGGPFPVTAQPLEDTRLLVIPRRAILDLLRGSSEIRTRMLGTFAKRKRQ